MVSPGPRCCRGFFGTVRLRPGVPHKHPVTSPAPSTARWLVVDTLHHCTGLKPPAWDFALLAKNVQAFELLVGIHYRYYQFNANMLVALAWSYATGGAAEGWRRAAYVGLAALFFLGSRDALRKYYDRAGRLLGARPPM